MTEQDLRDVVAREHPRWAVASVKLEAKRRFARLILAPCDEITGDQLAEMRARAQRYAGLGPWPEEQLARDVLDLIAALEKRAAAQ